MLNVKCLMLNVKCRSDLPVAIREESVESRAIEDL